MEAEEETSLANSSKATNSTQETAQIPAYSDWSSSIPAYYAGGATPFFASPNAHPYLWGAQHPLIPPYGTPLPYPALYAPGGIYGHPNISMTPSALHANMEMVDNTTNRKETKAPEPVKNTSDVKDTKKLKTLSSSVKGSESGKGTSGSGNDSAESGSEGSSDASDENTNLKDSCATKKGSFEKMLADGANAQNIQGIPATNLKIGMDLWNPSTCVKMRPNLGGEVSMPGHESDSNPNTNPNPNHQWIHDERELKRQKRKQSNRESARRSRLRKQAECEELQARVETLSDENRTLKEELHRLSEETKKLTSENTSIKEELSRVCGADALLSNIDESKSSPVLQKGKV